MKDSKKFVSFGEVVERTRSFFSVMSVRRAGSWVTRGNRVEVERRTGRKNILELKL